MMIDVTVANVDLDLTTLYTHMNPLTAGADLLWHSKDRLVFQTAGGDRFVMTGTDLHWGDTGLDGGAVATLTFRSNGVDLIRFANLQTTGTLLWAAMRADQSGADPAALTDLLVHHCWTYHGSTGVDYFPEISLAPFGTLNLTGNDKIFLNGGDDVFFTGAAQDTVLGGSGHDTIAGGSGNDVLLGGSGNDRLSGDEQDDRLEGGAGADTLNGGAGDDVLTGGRMADVLTGGSGADVFDFADGSGRDVISDYMPGLDHLRITGAAAITITDQGADVAVQFGSNTILLLGVAADQLTGADFL